MLMRAKSGKYKILINSYFSFIKTVLITKAKVIYFTEITGWCPQTWDEILCWPETAPNELAILPCPHYIAGFDTRVFITLYLITRQYKKRKIKF